MHAPVCMHPAGDEPGEGFACTGETWNQVPASTIAALTPQPPSMLPPAALHLFFGLRLNDSAMIAPGGLDDDVGIFLFEQGGGPTEAWC